MLPILLSVALLALSSARSPFFGKHQEAGRGALLRLCVGFVRCHGSEGAGREGGGGGGKPGLQVLKARIRPLTPWLTLHKVYLEPRTES